MSRQHGLVGLQVLELRKAKHCFAQVAACEANESKELSSGLAESWAEIQLSLHPLHQFCYACVTVKETMTAPNVLILFWILILPEQSRRIS